MLVDINVYKFMPNVFSHPYQLDESISNFRNVGWYFFYFHLNFGRHFCKQTVENPKMRRLIWSGTVCRCPTKRTLGLYGLRFWSELSTYNIQCFNLDMQKIVSFRSLSLDYLGLGKGKNPSGDI